MPRTPKTPEYPCSSCTKNVNKNHRAVLCDSCEMWIHIKCNYLNLTDYNKLKRDPLPFLCINCLNQTIPFSKLTDNELIPLIKKGIITPENNASQSTFSPHTAQMQNHINKLNLYLNKNFTQPDNDNDDDQNPDNDLISPSIAITLTMKSLTMQSLTPQSHSYYSITIYTPYKNILIASAPFFSCWNLTNSNLIYWQFQNKK